MKTLAIIIKSHTEAIVHSSSQEELNVIIINVTAQLQTITTATIICQTAYDVLQYATICYRTARTAF